RGSQVTSLLSSAEQDATTAEAAAVACDATPFGAPPAAVAIDITATPQLPEHVPAELPSATHHATQRQYTSDMLHDRDILSDRMSCREAPRIAGVLESLAVHVQSLGQMQQDAAGIARDEYGSRLRQLETDVGELLTLTRTLVGRINDLSNHVLLTEQTRNGPANDAREPAHEQLDVQEPLSDQQRLDDRRATDRWPLARLEYTRRLKPRAERRYGHWSPPHTSSTSEASDPPVVTPDPDLSSESRATRYFLSMEDDIVAAPSIGPRTADRMRSIGISSVRDFLDADPEEIAAEIGTSYLTANAVADWQDQSGLMLMIPELRVTHAQLFVGAGFRSAWAIQAADAADVQAAVLRFAVSRDGQRVLRDSPAPPADRIYNWIENAARADAKRAA
ncbi:MAG: helix-hairpin-helix domain-containing protein, partial [Pseudomonadota bacterium]